MSSAVKNILLFGQPAPLPETISLRAGPLTLVYDPAAGDLRYIKLGDALVLLRIYAAVRDQNWGTIPGRLREIERTVGEDSFRIAYESVHQSGEIDFRWRGEISGQSDGAVQFTFDGQAQSTFLKNRIGFCVLHSIRECAGAKCRALYLNGTEKELTFPEFIAPEQPVRWLHDLSGLAHEVTPEAWVDLRFDGDAFEMEDQRNWIDASFKTFCTPLRIPYPLEIKTGTCVRQTVTLLLVAQASRLFLGGNATQQRPAEFNIQKTAGGTPALLHRQDACATSGSATIRIGGGSVKLPPIGLGDSSNKSPDNFPNKSRLGALHLSHLRHDVKLASPDWGHELHCASLKATALDLPFELAVHLPRSSGDQLAELVAWHETMRSKFPHLQPIVRILVFQDGEKSTTKAALDTVRAAFAHFGVPIGAGTNADLYQLNLQRPPTEADFICWSMNPQVHAFDNSSIAETPEAAAQQIVSVRDYFPGKPLVVSPVTLKPRFNPVATGPEPTVPPGELPPQVDPRQMSLFGAAWTLAMIKALAEGGVESMTFFETTGWRGVMETDAGSPLPERFPSTPGAVFPLYHVLADVGEFAGGEVLRTTSSEPLTVQSLMLSHGKRRRLLLANLQPRPAQAMLTDFETPFLLRRLNATNVRQAMREPGAFRATGETTPSLAGDVSLVLAPYEIATLDFA